MIRPEEYRKIELQELAESISMEYFPKEIFQPHIIAEHNNITYSYGNYEDSFDGLLEHSFGEFHIFLNTDRSHHSEHPRMRFTFAHELAHYFIDEHRNALKSGKVPSHPSFNSMIANNPVEKEADYFAACLIMPSVKFKSYCHKRPLSGKLISDISAYFSTSTSATIFRYFDLCLFPMMIIMSINGKIEWRMASTDFKYKFIPKKGEDIPPTTAAGEFFLKGTKYTTEEIVFADDWFSDFNRSKDEQFFEKCYYLPSNKVMSIIWKKEK